MEIWKDIQGYEGIYQVSSHGRVKSLNYNKTGLEGILNPNNNGKGYLQVYLTKNKKSKKVLIHRLVAQAFLYKPIDKNYVNHKDGNKSNNNVNNLEWCTRSENQQHAFDTGLINKTKLSDTHKGERHWNYGKHWNKEAKDKMSKAHKGKQTGKNNPRARKVICITTGEVFDTLTEASLKYKIGNGDIVKCCKKQIKYRGKHPITNEPLVWRYYDESQNNNTWETNS